jgi:hypothetical protein
MGISVHNAERAWAVDPAVKHGHAVSLGKHAHAESLQTSPQGLLRPRDRALRAQRSEQLTVPG